jgi:hypothetical protein
MGNRRMPLEMVVKRTETSKIGDLKLDDNWFGIMLKENSPYHGRNLR